MESLDFPQLVGFVALFFVLLSFSFNNRKAILFLAVVSQFIFAIHYYLLSAYTGALLSILSSIRAYVFNNKKKYGIEKNLYVPLLFIVLIIVSTIFSWEGYHSLLLLAALIVEVAALWSDEPRRIRLLLLLTAPLWLTYNYIVNSYGGMIASSLIFVYLFISIIRFDVLGKKFNL